MWTTVTTRLLKVKVGVQNQQLVSQHRIHDKQIVGETGKDATLLCFINWRGDHIKYDS